MNSLPEDRKQFKLDDCQFELTAMNFLANEANANNMTDIGKAIGDKVNKLAQTIPMPQPQR
jgi:hypothetical protein